MGTRADFYVGRGEEAEWLGSIAWDGYPSAMPRRLIKASTESDFRRAVEALTSRDDWTAPAQGWPWPWDDSRTTDYAYAFDQDHVWASNYGHPWFVASRQQPDSDTEHTAMFPNMKSIQRITFGRRSGVLLVGIASKTSG